jgi:tight adherence protein C
MLILIGAGLLMVVFLGLALSGDRGDLAAERRLQRLVGNEDSAEIKQTMPGGIDRNTLLEQITNLFNSMGRVGKSSDSDVYASVRKRLLEAGYRSNASLSIYMGGRIGLAIALPLISVILSWSTGNTPSPVIIGIAAAAGYLSPGIYVDRRAVRRQAAIRHGLADAIDLMVICIDAGLSLGATIERVSVELNEIEPVIADEFRTTVAESRAGRGLMEALRGMGERTGNVELRTLVTLLIQTDRFGTPLVNTLRTQGEAMRFDRMQNAEEQAQKAPVKMMLPAVLIFVATIIVMGGPAAITLLDTLQP